MYLLPATLALLVTTSFSLPHDELPSNWPLSPHFSHSVSASASAPAKCTCLPGGIRDKPISGPSYPPCWYKQPDGHYDCYEKINGNCPWPGSKPPCPDDAAPPKCICLPGGMADKPISGPTYPPCWYKQADGHWDCYEKVAGNCPWKGAMDPQCPSAKAVSGVDGGEGKEKETDGGQGVLSVTLRVEVAEGVKVEI